MVRQQTIEICATIDTMNYQILHNPTNIRKLWNNTDISPQFLSETTIDLIAGGHRQSLFVIFEGKIIGALVWNSSSLYCSDKIGIGFISVVDSYKNKGIATAMFKQLQTIIGTKKKIYPGQYEPEGLLYFQKMVDQHNSL